MAATNRTLTIVVAFLAAMVVILAVLITVGWLKLGTTDRNLTQVTTVTCQIQGSALRAEPYLVGYLQNLHTLTTLAPDQREAQLPPKRRRFELAVLFDLNWSLAHYLPFVRKAPAARSCRPGAATPARGRRSRAGSLAAPALPPALRSTRPVPPERRRRARRHRSVGTAHCGCRRHHHGPHHHRQPGRSR